MINPELSGLADQVLASIRRRPKHFCSIARLAKKLGCEKTDIISAVDFLRETGYQVKTKRKEECAFISAPDLLLAAEITHGLKTSMIGKTAYSFKSVQSTNTIASKLADIHAVKGSIPKGAVPEGTIVVAESQTKGRGRMGRKWFSLEGKGICLSIILYPDIDPASAPGISLLTAVSLADTFAGYGSMKVGIKWPNDCLLNGRKAAGILTELSAEIGQVHYVIVGVGINVNQLRNDFPRAVAKTATSLRAETNKEIGRVEFLQRFLTAFEKDYRRFQKSGLKGLRKRILAYSNLIGNKVRLDMRGSIISGKAVDIDENGNLVLDTADGRRSFNAGEVTLLKR